MCVCVCVCVCGVCVWGGSYVFLKAKRPFTPSSVKFTNPPRSRDSRGKSTRVEIYSESEIREEKGKGRSQTCHEREKLINKEFATGELD